MSGMRRFRPSAGVATVAFAWAAALADLHGQPPPSGASLQLGVYTAAQAERGRAAYSQHCSRCHGENLAGRRDYPLSGERFVDRWEAHTVEHLFVVVRDSMPPDGPDTVDANDKRDIVAFLLQQNGFPDGTTELSRDEAVLATLAIERTSGRPAARIGSLVHATGCLTPRGEREWTLTRATEPEKTALPTPGGADKPPSSALGTRDVELVNVFPSPAAHRGHTMRAIGFLMKNDDGDAINVVTLEMIAPGCGN